MYELLENCTGIKTGFIGFLALTFMQTMSNVAHKLFSFIGEVFLMVDVCQLPIQIINKKKLI